jgi:hypothetical protein
MNHNSEIKKTEIKINKESNELIIESKENKKKWKEFIINNDKDKEEGLKHLKNFQYERYD